MYKDKDKQREADRERQRRYRTKRDKHGVTKGVTNRRCDKQGVTSVIDGSMQDGYYEKVKDIKPNQDEPYQMTVMERLFYRPANKLGRGETNFVSLPGRACYDVFKRRQGKLGAI